MIQFRPLLAPSDSPLKNKKYWDFIPFPCFVSPKIDGIRATIINRRAKSRKLEDLRSYQVQEEFTSIDWLDGEMAVGNPSAWNVYNLCQSHIMAFNKPGDIGYHVFDYCHPEWHDTPFYKRLEKAQELIKGKPSSIDDWTGYHLVEHIEVNSMEELLEAEEKFLAMGYEGIMIRNPVGRYKMNRATLRECIIFKLKREEDDEGILEDLVERVINTNEQETSELGYAKRSKAAEGLVPAGTTGKFKLRYKERLISCAPGQFNHEQLQDIWDHWPRDKGKFIKFRHFPHGAKDELRQARALGFRDEMDM